MTASREFSDTFGDALLSANVPVPEGVVGPDGQPAPKRFNVYRNNVVVSLCEAMAATYPAIQNLVGEEYFTALAREFVTRHPPTSAVMLWYGGDFPSFIDAFPPLASYPYLGDVARLEWGSLDSYHSADAEPLDPLMLASLAPEQLAAVRFHEHPATKIIQSSWPIHALIEANRFSPGQNRPVDMTSAETVMVTRPDVDVILTSLRPGGAVFFQSLLDGEALGEAASRALEADETFDLSENLADALKTGTFAALM